MVFVLDRGKVGQLLSSLDQLSLASVGMKLDPDHSSVCHCIQFFAYLYSFVEHSIRETNVFISHNLVS